MEKVEFELAKLFKVQLRDGCFRFLHALVIRYCLADNIF
jgi:hypothetical protein